MTLRLSTYQIPLAVLILLFSSCEKSDEHNIKSANFIVSSETVYLNEPCDFKAQDSLGGSIYYWNFGDGSSQKAGFNVSHPYTKPGTFTASLNILFQYSKTKTIRVLPGRISYQISNSSKYFLDFLIYLDNYEAGCTSRMQVNSNSTSNITFCTSNIYTNDSIAKQHILGISIFVENSEYTFPDLVWIKDFQHHIISITDSTKLIPRSSHGNTQVVLLRDLFPF